MATRKKLDSETIQEIVNYAIEFYKKEEINAARTRYDRKRANTKILLRNYRSLRDHCESAIYDASNMEEEANLAELLGLMSDNGRASFRVESIKESAVRTKLIIDHINKMLDLYKVYCDCSPKPEDARRYKIIYDMYISDDMKNTEQIAEYYNIGSSTIYRDIDTAVECLTSMIFGIDGLYFSQQ